MAFILNIVRVIADMNIACTGEVAMIESKTILIDSHDGGPDPLPWPPPCRFCLSSLL